MLTYLTVRSWLVARFEAHRDERGISTIIEILAACLLVILVYAAIKTNVEDGVRNTITNVFDKINA